MSDCCYYQIEMNFNHSKNTEVPFNTVNILSDYSSHLILDKQWIKVQNLLMEINRKKILMGIILGLQ